tara:strand:- start:144 stop:455 length:312 start_codon:yes stop_codon:yes gene_type:complete
LKNEWALARPERDTKRGCGATFHGFSQRTNHQSKIPQTSTLTTAENRLSATSEDNQISAQNNIVEDGAYVDGGLDVDTLLSEDDFKSDIIEVHAGDYMNAKDT